MRRIRRTLACVLLALVGSAGQSGAVVNGSVVDAHTVPFTVALLFRSRPNPFLAQFCGGEYVDQYWVLTAAHCVVGRKANDVQTASAITNLSDITAGDRRDIAEIVVDPKFDPLRVTDDVAMLRLVDPVPAAWVIPLNTDAAAPALNAPLKVYGWGLVDGGPGGLSYTNQLHVGAVTDFAGPTGSCATLGGIPYNPHFHLCAAGRISGGPQIVDSCNGDSGGPLVAWTTRGPRLVGTVDFGDDLCGESYAYPGIYARTSTLAPWINAVVATTPHVSIADSAITEGNPAYGNKTMHFSVTLDHAIGGAVQVDYVTRDGSAKAGSDYKATHGTMTIPAGAVSRGVDVTIVSDRVHEPLEGFFVTLSNPRAARLGRGAAIGWITDND